MFSRSMVAVFAALAIATMAGGTRGHEPATGAKRDADQVHVAALGSHIMHS